MVVVVVVVRPSFSARFMSDPTYLLNHEPGIPYLRHFKLYLIGSMLRQSSAIRLIELSSHLSWTVLYAEETDGVLGFHQWVYPCYREIFPMCHPCSQR